MICPNCNGTGADYDNWKAQMMAPDCPHCKGTGQASTRQFARQLERDATWRPTPEVYDEGSGLELWNGDLLGYNEFTVDVGEADGAFWATVARWFMSSDVGWDVAQEIDLGPFHSVDRAKRRALVWIANQEAIAWAENAKLDEIMRGME